MTWKQAVLKGGSLLLLLPVLTLVACTSRNDQPESYPERPLEIIVPFAPGGGSDLLARIMKLELDEQKLLPHSAVIINVPGAGGTIGSRRVMHAKPDGYTVLLLHDGMLTARHSGKVLYGPEAFQPVAATGRSGMVIAVHESASYQSLRDLLDVAADKPNSITFAANLGAPSHFIGLMLEKEHGSAKFRFAQTGGGADRFAAIKGRHAEATAFSVEEYLRFRSDGVRAIATMGEKRQPQLPELLTASEQGISVNYSVMQYWWMPKGSPDERVGRVANLLQKIVESNSIREKFATMNIDPVFLTGEQLQQHLETTEAQLAGVDAGTETPLPSVPAALALVTFVFGIVVAVQRVRHWRSDAASSPGLSSSSESNSKSSRADGAPAKSLLANWVGVAVIAGLVVAYCLAVIVFKTPLGLATFGFVLSGGLVLAKQERQSFSLGYVAILGGTSVAVGTLFHVVFTQLFQLGF